MTSFVSKCVLVLALVFFGSSAALAGGQSGCHFAFGSGVTQQVVDYPGMMPNPNPNLGFVYLRIGRVLLKGTVDHKVTHGFNIPSVNPATGESRITGYAEGTFDFGELGRFHTWEVDTVTLLGPWPWETSSLLGDIRTGPRRGLVPTPDTPPVWGEGFFAHADVTFRGMGWNRFEVLNDDNQLVNEFTYLLWGKICGIDLKGIKKAQRNK